MNREIRITTLPSGVIMLEINGQILAVEGHASEAAYGLDDAAELLRSIAPDRYGPPSATVTDGAGGATVDTGSETLAVRWFDDNGPYVVHIGVSGCWVAYQDHGGETLILTPAPSHLHGSSLYDNADARAAVSQIVRLVILLREILEEHGGAS